MTERSFKAIVQNYISTKLRDELRGEWGTVVFYRLPAMALARVSIALGISANALTIFGFATLPALAALAWMLPAENALPWIITVGIAFNILDCADGTVARATNTQTKAGAYLDFANDVLYRNVMLASIGLAADKLQPNSLFPWVATGLICAVLATYARLNRSHIQIFNLPDSGSEKHWSKFDYIYAFLSGLDTLLPLLTLLAWQLGSLNLLLLWLILYTGVDATIAVIENYRRLLKHK